MNKQKKNGYSLVEIVVYLAIFTAMSIVVINSFVVVLNSFRVTRTNRLLLEAASTSVERISREIRQATSIDLANSTFGSSTGVLQLNSIDGSGNAQTVKFSVTNGALNLYQNGTLIDNLLGQNVLVTNLIFRRISTTHGEAIKIELTLQDVALKYNAVNFYDTIILRGEY